MSVGLCGAAKQASGLARFVWIGISEAHHRVETDVGAAWFSIIGDDAPRITHAICRRDSATKVITAGPSECDSWLGNATKTAVTATLCSRCFEDERAPTKLHL